MITNQNLPVRIISNLRIVSVKKTYTPCPIYSFVLFFALVSYNYSTITRLTKRTVFSIIFYCPVFLSICNVFRVRQKYIAFIFFDQCTRSKRDSERESLQIDGLSINTSLTDKLSTVREWEKHLNQHLLFFAFVHKACMIWRTDGSVFCSVGLNVYIPWLPCINLDIIIPSVKRRRAYIIAYNLDYNILWIRENRLVPSTDESRHAFFITPDSERLRYNIFVCEQQTNNTYVSRYL